MSSEDRKKRDLDLLMKSYKALEAEQASDVPDDEDDAGNAGDDEVIMYRGRPVRRSSGAIPGAGSSQGSPRQFRGAGAGKKKGRDRRNTDRRSTDTDSLKAALAKLTELHQEGLITKAEYDAKRAQILDRL